MKYLIDKLRSNRRLDAEEYKALLLCRDTELAAYLQELAREEALARFGNKIFIRGLIEITNRCRNNCYYCGIRKENRNITRYELAQEEILSCAMKAIGWAFRTFVLQGGEAPAVKDEGMVETVAAIRQSFPDCAITLSLGEKSREAYERFFLAGANRYLLRHGNLQRRALSPASSCGDVPFPSVAMLGLAERDRLSSGNRNHGGQSRTDTGASGRRYPLYRRVPSADDRNRSPSLPHHDTPFAACPPGNMEQTLLLLSIFRLMHPRALIPSTTALATLDPRRKRTRHSGRSQRSHAESVSRRRTKQICPFMTTRLPWEPKQPKDSPCWISV